MRMRTWIAYVGCLAALSCAPSSDDTGRGTTTLAPDSALAARPAFAAYEALLPALDTMVSQTWDGAYGHSLRLDRQALVDRLASPTDSAETVSVAEAQRWINRGFFTGVCPPPPLGRPCTPDGAVLVVQLSPVAWYGDSARVELLFYTDTFGSTWEVWLARRGATWRLKSRRMTGIS